MPACFDISPGDRIIAGGVELSLEYKTGARARIVVTAPAEIKIKHDKTRRMSAATMESTHGKHPVRQGPATIS
jgi:hypothetical protein